MSDNTATRIARLFNNDGRVLVVDGLTIQAACAVEPHDEYGYGSDVVFEFADGSAIAITAGAWDTVSWDEDDGAFYSVELDGARTVNGWRFPAAPAVVAGRRFRVSDEGSSDILTADSAQEAAEEWVEGGDWGDGSSTTWVNVTVHEVDGQGNDVDGTREHITITIEPTEPTCPAGSHDWKSPHAIVGGLVENPGVWGHRGGVKTLEICMVCGCSKRTDTWAQNPSTGEQGLTEVAYKAGEFRDEVAALASAGE